MIFSSKTVVSYISRGARYVATIRKPYYHEGQRVELELGDKKLKGKVIKVLPVSEARKYVHISGFKSVDEWLSEAKRVHRVEDLSGLVIVVLRVEGEDRGFTSEKKGKRGQKI
mgnify:CR=1 FL=1